MKQDHSDAGEAKHPPIAQPSGMSAEDWRLAGLAVLLMLAEAYHAMLKAVIPWASWCAVSDADINICYLWVITSLQSLLMEHVDLRDFPQKFKPIFPDLNPSTILDADWENEIAPYAECFLGEVRQYIKKRGLYKPEHDSPALTFVELFRPGVTAALESAIAYRKRVLQQCHKKPGATANAKAPALKTTGNTSAPAVAAPPLDPDKMSTSTTPEILERIMKNTDLVPMVLQKVVDAPLRTAALLRPKIRSKIGTLGDVVEIDFKASPHFKNITWRGKQYVLKEKAARIIETLYIAQKDYDLPSMHQKEIFGLIYTSDKRKWPSGNIRIQNFFRTKDAKRLWDDGCIVHDNQGNFHLNIKIHTHTQ